MRYFTTHKARAAAGAALGCVLVAGLTAGCDASSRDDDRLGTPVSVAPSAGPSTQAQPVDTADQALAIALADTGLTKDQVTEVMVTQESDDGVLLWDVELYYEGQRVGVDVRASDGMVVDREGPRPGTTAPDGTTVMPVDQAKQIVSARVPNATSIHIELDRDDGRFVYEGEVIGSGEKYDFEIDAVTGDVLEWEADHLD